MGGSTMAAVRRVVVGLCTVSLVASVGAVAHTGSSGTQRTPSTSSEIAAPPGARIAARQPIADVEDEAITTATQLRALPLRDGTDDGRYCPADRMSVIWDKPEGAYENGAYVEPLGPAPGPKTTTVNGVVVCAGSLYAYMGFEASRSEEGWQIIPVPEVGHNDEAGLNDDHDEPVDLDAGKKPAKGASGGTPAALIKALGKGLTSPKASTFTAAIEPFAAYQPQASCSPSAKPGVLAWRDKLLKAFPGSRNLGITRGCGVGGLSEHKEGRAFDWGVNVNNASERAKAQRVIDFLFAKDEFGNDHAMARRLGIMYIVWNRKIWGSYRSSQGWRPYSGASAHTDHIHFSFAWAGARGETSFWTGKVADMPGARSGGSSGWQNVSYSSGSSKGSGSGSGAARQQPSKEQRETWRKQWEARREEARKQREANSESWRQEAQKRREEWRAEWEKRQQEWRQRLEEQEQAESSDASSEQVSDADREAQRTARRQARREARREAWRKAAEERRQAVKQQAEERRQRLRRSAEERRQRWQRSSSERRTQWRQRSGARRWSRRG